MRKIITKGITTYRVTCDECNAIFTYEREDIRPNYIKGGEWVSCPSCGHSVRHLGGYGQSPWDDYCGKKYIWRGGRVGRVIVTFPTDACERARADIARPVWMGA
ncbi:MAG: hypothetical protein KGH64_04340 [Candidatus Micrarchaeota archaeon]|nr:hypothetical protein [Candidatus Micrarchaeota archaeon]